MPYKEDEDAHLLQRRFKTIGSHSPLFYQHPLHLLTGKDVWLYSADGSQYLDCYNNVPHLGHCNTAVIAAMYEQANRLNIHTRYLSEPVIAYGEKLLSLFPEKLDKVFFVNSGTEANELAIRICRQQSGHKGVLISNWSYHGNSYSLARMTTGLKTAEGLADYVKPIHIPDIHNSDLSEEKLLHFALAEVDQAISDLQKAGFGVAMFLFDPIFSTEGLVVPPKGYIEGVSERVHKAGGFVVGDEVQSGVGRTGEKTWGFELYDVIPDFVTMGKPMGNGHPIGAVVTSTAILECFGTKNEYFNTFAGNPVSAAIGLTVLQEMERLDVKNNAAKLGSYIMERLTKFVEHYDFVKHARGRGLFFGLELITQDGEPDPQRTRDIVEMMKEKGVIISKIGRYDNVLKIRPPMVFQKQHADILLERLEDTLNFFNN